MYNLLGKVPVISDADSQSRAKAAMIVELSRVESRFTNANIGQIGPKRQEKLRLLLTVTFFKLAINSGTVAKLSGHPLELLELFQLE